MKKIIFILTALTMSLVVMIIGFPVHASELESRSIYTYDAFSESKTGITLNIAEGTNVFTVNGTASSNTSFNLPLLHTANANGSVLSVSNYYAYVVEYISGTATFNQNTNYIRNVHATATAQLANFVASNYQGVFGFLIVPGTTTGHQVAFNQGTILNNLVFKVHIIPVSNPQTNDINFFTSGQLLSLGSASVSITTPGTVVINGSTSQGDSLNLTPYVNSNLKNASSIYLYIIEISSGTVSYSNGRPVPLQFNSEDNLSKTHSNGSFQYYGYLGTHISSFTTTRTNVPDTVSYTNYTFKINVQEIQIYNEPSTPPEGVHLSGAFWQNKIKFNDISDPFNIATTNPWASFVYLSTTTSNTFDLSLFDQETLTLTSTSPWNRFYIGRTSGGYEEIGGTGDFIYKKEASNLVIERLIDDELDDSISAPLSDVDFLVIQYGEGNIHTVTFNTAGGSSLASQSVLHGRNAIIPTNPTRTGYAFQHWIIEGTQTAYVFSTPVTSDLTLKAVWNPLPGTIRTVTFQMNGGSPDYGVVYVENGSLLSPPPNPTRPGHTFVEWRVIGTGQPFNFNAAVTSDVSLSAVWESNGAVVHQITFISSGGSSVGNIMVEQGNQADAPSEPMRSGYSFVHWVITGTTTVFDFSTPITANLSLTAVWEENEVYFFVITFIENGGSQVQDQVVNEGDYPVQPEDPVRPGYTFGGWYSNIALTTEYVFVDEPMESDITLYAKWVPVTGGGNPIETPTEASSSTWLYITLGVVIILVIGATQTKSKKGRRG